MIYVSPGGGVVDSGVKTEIEIGAGFGFGGGGVVGVGAEKWVASGTVGGGGLLASLLLLGRGLLLGGLGLFCGGFGFEIGVWNGVPFWIKLE